jgi:hypothetical protein
LAIRHHKINQAGGQAMSNPDEELKSFIKALDLGELTKDPVAFSNLARDIVWAKYKEASMRSPLPFPFVYFNPNTMSLNSHTMLMVDTMMGSAKIFSLGYLKQTQTIILKPEDTGFPVTIYDKNKYPSAHISCKRFIAQVQALNPNFAIRHRYEVRLADLPTLGKCLVVDLTKTLN